MECKKLLAVFFILAAASSAFSKSKKTVGQNAAPNDFKSAPSSASASENSRYTISAIDAPNEGQNYYITKDEKQNLRFVQKLSWNKIADIKCYRITIERQGDGGAWTEILQKDLFENKIEVSLEAGTYRFQIGVINLFDQLEKKSEWKNFEVLKALQPKIQEMQTESMFLNSKKADGVFFISGENLTEGTIFTMEKKNSEPPKIIRGKILSVEPDGNGARVQFDIEKIDEGKYEIYAQNPGGLSVISKTLNIKNKNDRTWRLLLEAGYACPLTFFDGTLDKYTDGRFYPISGTARLEVIPFHTKAGDFGFGAGANYSRFSNETQKISMSGNYANALAYFVWQKYFVPKKLCLDFHVGAGAASLFGVQFENKAFGGQSPELNSLALAFGGGLGIQWHFGEHFYLEGNVDFIDAKFKDMNLGMLYPSLALGVMF